MKAYAESLKSGRYAIKETCNNNSKMARGSNRDAVKKE